MTICGSKGSEVPLELNKCLGAKFPQFPNLILGSKDEELSFKSLFTGHNDPEVLCSIQSLCSKGYMLYNKHKINNL